MPSWSRTMMFTRSGYAAQWIVTTSRFRNPPNTSRASACLAKNCASLEFPSIRYLLRLRIGCRATEMDQYMAAADLLVGKAGGLTTSEALARALPMALVEPIPGQEERNSDHLLEAGAAIRCNNLPVAAWKNWRTAR